MLLLGTFNVRFFIVVDADKLITVSLFPVTMITTLSVAVGTRVGNQFVGVLKSLVAKGLKKLVPSPIHLTVGVWADKIVGIESKAIIRIAVEVLVNCLFNNLIQKHVIAFIALVFCGFIMVTKFLGITQALSSIR